MTDDQRALDDAVILSPEVMWWEMQTAPITVDEEREVVRQLYEQLLRAPHEMENPPGLNPGRPDVILDFLHRLRG